MASMYNAMQCSDRLDEALNTNITTTTIMNLHEKINYLEFPAIDIEATKTFFSAVFGWRFVDYGAAYTAFSNAGIDGGFYQAKLCVDPSKGSALVVFYSAELAQTQAKIVAAGGIISTATFSFPGGRRFHFKDPNGNEFAVWTEIVE